MYQLALEGVRVVDFSWVVAGPFCTKLLGLMGAEVIKVESTTRPQYKNRKGWFCTLNNSKKSCAVNLSTEEGKALVKRLISVSDLVVENFSTGVMDRLGLGYDEVRRLRPDIIYVSSSGLGRTGPGKDYPAYGTLLQGFSGWTSLFCTPNSKMETMGVLPSWTDPVTALWETLAIMGALFYRSGTGKSVYIDLSMLESTIAVMGDLYLEHAATGKTPVPGVSSLAACAVPYGIYPCKEEDAWLAISVRSQSEWEALCNVLGNPAWCQDEGLLSQEGRLAKREKVDRFLAELTAEMPLMELFQRLQAAGVPAGPCYNFRQLLEDPQFRLRGLHCSIPLEEGKTQFTQGLPWLDESGWKGNLFKPPELGEHNEYVFLELLGLSVHEYEDYRRRGIIE